MAAVEQRLTGDGLEAGVVCVSEEGVVLTTFLLGVLALRFGDLAGKGGLARLFAGDWSLVGVLALGAGLFLVLLTMFSNDNWQLNAKHR